MELKRCEDFLSLEVQARKRPSRVRVRVTSSTMRAGARQRGGGVAG